MENPLDFTCKSIGFTLFFVSNLIVFVLFVFFVFGVLLFGDGSRGVLCHSWFLRVC